MWICDDWKDYELIDADGGERLERWGDWILVRPDPQIIWSGEREDSRWKNADGVYRRSRSGGGRWVVSRMPEEWCINYGKLVFKLRPMGFKHTGLFPEQAVNWDWFSALIKDRRLKCPDREVSVLNLFAYTGGATAAAAAAGASVCHVDASKGMVGAAKENLRLSGLAEAPVRYIVDDCKKFVEREIRRGRRYDGIIMDPPSYGRGPSGEVWKLEECADELIGLAASLLSDDPLFFLVNSYTTGLSPASMGYMVMRAVGLRGHMEAQEIGLRVTSTGLCLPAGASARWTPEKAPEGVCAGTSSGIAAGTDDETPAGRVGKFAEKANVEITHKESGNNSGRYKANEPYKAGGAVRRHTPDKSANAGAAGKAGSGGKAGKASFSAKSYKTDKTNNKRKANKANAENGRKGKGAGVK